MHKYVNTSVILSLAGLGHNLQSRMSTFIEIKDYIIWYATHITLDMREVDRVLEFYDGHVGERRAV